MHFALILALIGPVKSTTVLYGFESLEKCVAQARDIAAARKSERLSLTCVPAHEAD